jgi:hypothetical protein
MEPWSPVPHKIRDLGLSANAIAVFTIMATCQNKGMCFPSIRYLRAKTKLGTNSVLAAIAELVESKLVAKVQEKGKSNRYQLIADCYYSSNTTVTDAVTPIPATVTTVVTPDKPTVTTVVTPDKPTVTDAVTPPLLQQERTVTTVVTELQSLTKDNIHEDIHEDVYIPEPAQNPNKPVYDAFNRKWPLIINGLIMDKLDACVRIGGLDATLGAIEKSNVGDGKYILQIVKNAKARGDIKKLEAIGRGEPLPRNNGGKRNDCPDLSEYDNY